MAHTCFQFVKRMNGNITIGEEPAFGCLTCFQFVKRMNGNYCAPFHNQPRKILSSCFQFVKRMNGNQKARRSGVLQVLQVLLPIREAYEWKLPVKTLARLLTSWSSESLLPIREAYEWKLNRTLKSSLYVPCFQFVKRMNGNFQRVTFATLQRILLPIREAYEWKLFAVSTPSQTHLPLASNS